MAADYDINGVNAGIDAGQLFNNLENTFIANRKEIFAGAMKTEDWRGEVLNRFRAYNEANSVAALNALSEARRLTEEQIGISFNSGVELAQRHLQAVKKPKENEAKEFLQTVLNGAVSGAMAGLISTSVYALQQAQNQYLNIAYTVNPGAEDMGREIDRAQAVWLKRGIPGAKTAAGDKEMSAQAEFILRDNSHSALVQAEGRTAALAGVALVLISSHPSSCPLCLPWQNKVVIDDVNNDGKPDGKHELLSTAVSEGFWHYNCRHEVIPYIEGETNPNYYKRNTASPKETAMRYAVEQEQRYNERNIREWKRVEAGAMDETLRRNARMRVEEWQAKQRALAKVAKEEGIPYYRQYAREQIGGESKPSLTPMSKSLANIEPTEYNIKKEERRIDLIRQYKETVDKGEVTDVGFSNYEKVMQEAKEKIIGVRLANGEKVESIAKHLVDRIIGSEKEERLGVSIDKVIETLEKGKFNDIKIDKFGRKSIKFIYNNIEVTFNPDTKIIIQANPRSRK